MPGLTWFYAPQNRASKPTVRTLPDVSQFRESSHTLMGPGVRVESVETCQSALTPDILFRYSSEHVDDGVQLQGDVQTPVAPPPDFINHERKRKVNPGTAAEIDEELGARKKIKISVVPAVNLYE
jgi:hypothetical protein